MRDALRDLRRRAIARSAFRSADAHEMPMCECEALFIGIPWAGRIGVSPLLVSAAESELAANCRETHITGMKTAAIFTARIVRDGKWFIAFSPEFPEGNGQGLTEEESLESLRESILLLLEDRREDARASLGSGEKLIPLW
jgi:predicted RNase H-like HicB family nuclease